MTVERRAAARTTGARSVLRAAERQQSAAVDAYGRWPRRQLFAPCRWRHGFGKTEVYFEAIAENMAAAGSH
jgi:primosomal protein N'